MNEISKTVASATMVVVNGIETVTGFPLVAPDGSADAPSYSFANDTGSGLYLTPGGDMSMSVSGVTSWAMSPASNVTLAGGVPVSYGGGSGVLHLPQVSSPPSAAPNGGSGGALYVSSESLFFTNNLGVNVNLTNLSGDLNGPGSSSDDRAVVFSGISGKIIKNSTLFLDAANSAVLTPSGTAGAPSFSFGSDPTTGMYNPSADELGFASEGVLRMHLNSSEVTFTTPLRLPAGSAANPGLGISDGGMYFSDGSVVFANDSTACMAVSPGPNIALGGGIPTNYGSGAGVTLLHQVTVAPTGASTGGISVYTDGNSVKGMTTSGAVIDLASCVEGPASSTDNTIARFDGAGDLLKGSNVTVADTGEVTAPTGSVTLPTYSFSSDTGTGLYQVGSDSLGVSTEGVNRVTFDTSGKSTSTVRLLASNGAVGAPSLSFTGDTDTGIYTDATNVIFSGNAKPALAVSPGRNLSVGGVASSYGGGSGVVFFNQAAVDPTTNPTNGGLLYVPAGDVEVLRYRSDTGVVTDVNGNLDGPDVSVDRAVARWDGTSGNVIKNSNVTVSAAGSMLGVDGDASSPSYGLVGDTDTGLFSSGSLGVSVGGSEALTVSVASVTSSVSVAVPSGLVGTPSISFTSDTDTGLFHPSADTVSFVGGGSAGMAVTLIPGGTNPNVTLCSGTLGYGGTTEGERVVKIDDVSVAPSGTATGGGRLYVSGTSAFYHDYLGGIVDLTELATGPGTSAVGNILRWDGTSGNVVQSSTLSIVGDDVVAGDRAAGAPSFSFTSATDAGVYFPDADSISVDASGVAQLTVGTDVTVVPALYADTSVEIGGASGVNYSLSGTNFISDVQAGTGSFTWSNTTGSIMSTSGLDLSFTNNMVFTEGTETFSIGHDGTNYVFDSAGTSPNELSVRVAGSSLFTFDSTGDISCPALTSSGRVVATSTVSSTSDYVFTNIIGNRGLLHFDTNSWGAGLGSAAAISFHPDNNVTFGGTAKPLSGEGTVTIANITSPVTSGIANHFLLYAEFGAGVYGLGGMTSSSDRTLLDAGRERAKITLTTSIPTSTVTDTDGLTWVEVDVNGVSGTTTGRMVTSDDCFVGFTATAVWASNSVGFRRLSVMRRAAGPVYTELNSVSIMAVNGDVTTQTVYFFGSTTDELTVRVEQTSGGALSVDLSASFVRYTTNV